MKMPKMKWRKTQYCGRPAWEWRVASHVDKEDRAIFFTCVFFGRVCKTTSRFQPYEGCWQVGMSEPRYYDRGDFSTLTMAKKHVEMQVQRIFETMETNE